MGGRRHWERFRFLAHPPPDQPSIVEYCRGRLARHKLPARVIVVDQLPCNSTGKVMKEELRRRHAG